MGQSPKSTEQKMSDVLLAKSYFPEINEGRADGTKAMLERVYRAVARQSGKWTRRRVRAIWNEEAAGVRYHEMVELSKAAEAKRQAVDALEKARKEHADFIAQTSRIQALLVAQDPDFHSDEIARLGDVMGGMDRPGNKGE